MVKHLPCGAGEVGSTPGGGTKIPPATEQPSPHSAASGGPTPQLKDLCHNESSRDTAKSQCSQTINKKTLKKVVTESQGSFNVGSKKPKLLSVAYKKQYDPGLSPSSTAVLPLQASLRSANALPFPASGSWHSLLPLPAVTFSPDLCVASSCSHLDLRSHGTSSKRACSAPG